MNSTKEIGLKFMRGFGLNFSVFADTDYAAASNDKMSSSPDVCRRPCVSPSMLCW